MLNKCFKKYILIHCTVLIEKMVGEIIYFIKTRTKGCYDAQK